jgi:hypothetical protein
MAVNVSRDAGTGVADIMKEAGLTHGGFYAGALLTRCASRR